MITLSTQASGNGRRPDRVAGLIGFEASTPAVTSVPHRTGTLVAATRPLSPTTAGIAEAEICRSPGGETVVCTVFDAERLETAVSEFVPSLVMQQLTENGGATSADHGTSRFGAAQVGAQMTVDPRENLPAPPLAVVMPYDIEVQSQWTSISR
jgi:hypothetical protein